MIDQSPLAILRLGSNGITDVALLARKISRPTRCVLRQLDLSDNRLKRAAGKQIGDALLDCSLETLVLANNPLSGPGIEHICMGLASPNCDLKSLDVSACSLGIPGADKMAGALAVNSVLESLALGSNAIQMYGADLLADGLRNNQSLTSLRLDNNRLGHNGLEKLMEQLGNKPSLRFLSLSQN